MSVEVEPAATDALVDQTLRIDTPEHVTIDYPLAGLGSRFAALVVDGVYVVVLGIFLPVLLRLIAEAIELGISDALAQALMGLWVAMVFWGYFFFFEGFRDGQTPGKRLLSVRVMMGDGSPVTVQAAAVRNLVRVVDLQPGIACLVGGFSMMVTRNGRRLGDLAGGTVVVRELAVEFPDVRDVEESVGAPRLDDAAFEALRTFAERASQLKSEIRRPLARNILRALPVEVQRESDALADFVRYGARTEADPTHELVDLYRDETARRFAARESIAAGTAAAVKLLRARRGTWESFRERVRSVRRRGLRDLSGEEVSEFAAEYREVTSDLARARTYGASPRTVFALERIVGSAHNLFYRPVQQGGRRLVRWVTGGFPRLVRKRRRPIGLAMALLYGPALVAWFLVTADPSLEGLFDPTGSIIERAEKAAAGAADYRETWGGVWIGSDALSAFLIANNVQVAFVAFAGGVLAGLGTAFSMVFNGLHLGSALATFHNRGVLDNIGLFVLPHGVIEMTAICIAGGAGLWMGSGLVLPGRERRLKAFAERGLEAVSLIGGVVMMLVVAGFIEGFISPSRIFPAPVKLLAAACAATGMVAYLAFAGRAAPR